MRKSVIRTKNGWFNCSFDGRMIIMNDSEPIPTSEVRTELAHCDYGFAINLESSELTFIKNRHDESGMHDKVPVSIDGNKIDLGRQEF